MTEAQLRKRHGWSKTSKMPARYVHLNNQDVEDAILKHYGIVKEDEKEKLKLPKKCELCGMFNQNNSKLCMGCSKPLDIKTAIELEENEKEEKTKLEKKLEEIGELKEQLVRKEQEDKERHESLLKLLKNEYQKGSVS